MTVWLLEAYGTDRRYSDDVRYRAYTTSARKAELFDRIPRIQFTDSGHGIVFRSAPHHGRRQPLRHGLADYVREQMDALKQAEKAGR